jgi:RimJ/RimL family protein N-acetyltransferase
MNMFRPRIRKALPTDSAEVLALLEKLFAESTYLLYEPGEMNVSVEAYAKKIADGIEKQNWMMFVAEGTPGLVGVVFGSRAQARRTSHSIVIGLGVLNDYWGEGIGGDLLASAEAWAKEQNIHRIELSVRTANSRAIRLYERVGFEREGLKRHAQKVAGEYVDEFSMSKLIYP